MKEETRLLKLRSKIGGELDPALDERIESLQKLSDSYDRRDRNVLVDFFWYGKTLLRSFNYRKESVQEVDDVTDIWDAERDLPYEQQVHMGHFVDAQADAFIGFARAIHLLPELVAFEIDVLSAVLDWANAHPKNFEYREVIEVELKARQEGKDTYIDEQPMVKSEEAPSIPKNYRTALDDMEGDFIPKRPTAHDLMVQSMKENGRVNFQELEVPIPATEQELDAIYEENQRKFREQQ